MISVVIPTYEQNGQGKKYLAILLKSLLNQIGIFDVIISDNSKNDEIKNLVDLFKTNSNLKITYIHNPIIGASENINNAIEHATYDFIKPMMMDDLLSSPQALMLFCNALKKNHWAVSNSHHIDEYGRVTANINAYWNNSLLKGINSIGMPSVIAFRKNEFKFDTNLKTLCDCEYYWLLHNKYGSPAWINFYLVQQRLHKDSLSRNQPHMGKKEYQYLKQKHGL